MSRRALSRPTILRPYLSGYSLARTFGDAAPDGSGSIHCGAVFSRLPGAPLTEVDLALFRPRSASVEPVAEVHLADMIRAAAHWADSMSQGGGQLGLDDRATMFNYGSLSPPIVSGENPRSWEYTADYSGVRVTAFLSSSRGSCGAEAEPSLTLSIYLPAFPDGEAVRSALSERQYGQEHQESAMYSIAPLPMVRLQHPLPMHPVKASFALGGDDRAATDTQVEPGTLWHPRPFRTFLSGPTVLHDQTLRDLEGTTATTLSATMTGLSLDAGGPPPPHGPGPYSEDAGVRYPDNANTYSAGHASDAQGEWLTNGAFGPGRIDMTFADAGRDVYGAPLDSGCGMGSKVSSRLTRQRTRPT